MQNLWYEISFPKIEDVKPLIINFIKEAKTIKGVKDVLLWGSAAKNFNKLNFRIKDINIVVVSSFFSEDLISVDKKAIKNKMTNEELEIDGYDPVSVNFTKELLKLNTNEFDTWLISSDKKILHLGPIVADKKEAAEVKKEAEKFATIETGISLDKINKASQTKRTNWYNNYLNHYSQQIQNMPSGWYQSEHENIKEILNECINIQ